MQADFGSSGQFVVFAVGHVEAEFRPDAETLTREPINTKARFLEAFSAGEDRAFNQFGKFCFRPKNRYLD